MSEQENTNTTPETAPAPGPSGPSISVPSTSTPAAPTPSFAPQAEEMLGALSKLVGQINMLQGGLNGLQGVIVDLRQDICGHLHKIQADVTFLRSSDNTLTQEVQTLSGQHRKFNLRLEEASEEIKELRAKIRDAQDQARAVRESTSNVDLKHESDIGAAISHVTTLENSIAALRADLQEHKVVAQNAQATANELAENLQEHKTQTKESHEKISEAVGAVVDELGIEGKVRLGRSVPPGEKPRTPTLVKITRENKGTLAAALASVIILTIQILLDQFNSRSHLRPMPPSYTPPALTAPAPGPAPTPQHGSY